MDLTYQRLIGLITLLSCLLSPAVFSFTPEQVRNYAFPFSLTVAETGQRIAWVVNEEGRRNVFVAEGPEFEPRQLTQYDVDDGQEITSLSLSADGNWVVFLRGGEHSSNWDGEATINPLSLPFPASVHMVSVPFAGGATTDLGEGMQPVVHPNSRLVTYEKDGQLWQQAIDGSSEPAALTKLRGRNHSPTWSPDGTHLAFISDRGDLAYIGIYKGPDASIVWADPDFDRDSYPHWSPDSKQIVYVRRPGVGGKPDPLLEDQHRPWELRVFDLASRQSERIWKAPTTLAGSYPRSQGGVNLHWTGDYIVFLSYEDGWPHLYRLKPGDPEAQLLTDGPFMVEHISASADGRYMLASANTGPDPLDKDRRHILEIDIQQATQRVLTPGEDLEWTPVRTADGEFTVFLSATVQRPPQPAGLKRGAADWKLLAQSPEGFPADRLVTPKQVVFKAADGLAIHGSLFTLGKTDKPRPAVIYIHGGPSRQMLLGWHYSSYYSNAYAMNQYLASQGFAVLAVNYRLGIGYGYDFQNPSESSWRGASEYLDIVAAGEWLAQQPDIDPTRIGVYGGSYGGYLTAMALGRDSRLFAAGVDIHGVHDRTLGRYQSRFEIDRFERSPDAERAPRVAWDSSPASDVTRWTSPVLIIHGDDDRNVDIEQSTDLVQRLRQQGVLLETMLIVDDSHHWMRHENQIRVNAATADFLIRRLNATATH
ncbi:MAG: prolyl oligopeptidase family serine peptidase [Pseudomonadota bacterium]